MPKRPPQPPAKPVSRQEVDRRIRRIREAMARGKWISSMAHDLATEWGVAVDTVQGYSTIASKLQYADTPADIARLRSVALSRLEMLSAKAEAKGQIRAAIAAIEALAKIAGAYAERVEIGGLQGGEPVRVQIYLPKETKD